MGVERKRTRLPHNLTVFFFFIQNKLAHCWLPTVGTLFEASRRLVGVGFGPPVSFCVSHHIARRSSARRFSFFCLFSSIILRSFFVFIQSLRTEPTTPPLLLSCTLDRVPSRSRFYVNFQRRSVVSRPLYVPVVVCNLQIERGHDVAEDR